MLPEFCKRGIGKILLNNVFQNLKSAQFSGRVRIAALANNSLANEAYQKYGFKPYEIIYEKEIDLD